MKISNLVGSLTCALVLTASSLAQADATISNPYGQEFKVSYALPSGQDDSVTLTKPVSNVGSANIKTPTKSAVAVTITDDDGNVIAKGTVKDDQNYLLQKTTKGYVLAWAGTLSYEEIYNGIALVNTLDEAYTVDLFGTSGSSGKKNVKVSRVLDFKGVEKLSKDDSKYEGVIHLSDGTTAKSQNAINLGRFAVIIKTYDGKVTLSDLGYIVPPKPKKK
jgi:hypothetical protein